MKKTLGILILVLCLLLAAGAVAEANTRVGYSPLPDGLKLKPNGFTAELSEDFSEGAAGSTENVIFTTVTLNIDVDQTDWNKLVTNGGLSDNNLRVHLTLKTPKDGFQIVESYDYTFPYWELEEEFDYNTVFNYASAGDLRDFSNKDFINSSPSFATYLRQNELISFSPEPQIQYLLTRWYNNENKDDYITDIVKLVFVPDSGTKKVSPSYVEGIQTDTSDQIVSTTVSSKKSEIKYRVKEGLSTLTTKIQAPADAVSCTYQNVGRNYTNPQTDTVTGDGISLSTPANQTSTNNYVMTWKMQDGSTRTQALVITVWVEGGKPTVAKRDELEALVDGRTMNFGLNPLAASLMTVEKNKDGVTGWMNIKLKNTTGIPSVTWSNDLSDGHYLVEVPVPEGAVTVKEMAPPENMFEELDEGYWDEYFFKEAATADSQESVVGLDKYVHEEGLLKNMTPNDKRIAVYAPYISTDVDRAMIRVFYFYDKDGNIINQDQKGLYVIVTVSELGVLTTTDVIPEGQLPDGTVVNPVLVSSSYTDWQLQTEYNIQSGNQAVQMNLTLLDEFGDEAQLEKGNNNVFYLPYPEGMSYESGATWTLRHYLNDEYTEYELLTVTATENGLRFETDSLSPFVLLWDMPAQETPIPDATEVPSTPDVPKTGDNTPLALCAALLALSLAAAAVLLRRKAVR